MKHHILFILFIFFLFFLLIIPLKYVSAQDIIFDWKYTATTGYSEGKCIATDSAGYVYVGGIINGNATFMDTTISASGSYNSFVAKITPAGKMVWFKWFKSSFCRVESICFDKENKFYISGIFGGSVAIFGDTTLHTHNAQSSTTNMFIIKYDTAGTMLWVKNTSGLDYVIGNGAMPCKKITVDSENNLIVTGRCYDDILYFDTTAVVPYNYPETGFLAKYNSSGQKLWVKKVGGANCYPYAVKCDNSSNILITGYFSNSVLFDTINVLTGYNNCDNIFIAKYYLNGFVCWAQRAAYGAEIYNAGYDMAIDSVNNIYLTGSYNSSGEFGGILFFSGGYSSEAFLAKYDSVGVALWAIPIGSSHLTSNITENFDLSVKLRNSNIFLFGTFQDTLNFNGVHLNSGFDNAVFLLKLDLDGNVLKSGQYLESQTYIWADELTIDKNSNIYITGFKQAIPNSVFIAKLNDSIPIFVNISKELHSQNDVKIYPNPTNGIIYIQSNPIYYQMSIIDITGKLVNNIHQLKESIDLTELKAGVYFIKVIYQDFTHIKKIIKF